MAIASIVIAGIGMAKADETSWSMGAGRATPGMVDSTNVFDTSNWAVNVGSGTQTNKMSSSADAGRGLLSGAGVDMRQLMIAAVVVLAVWYATSK